MTFAASEIVEIAIQIEVNGKDFYDVMVKKSKNKKAKDLFEYLAKQEEEHMETFRNMLSSLKTYEPKEAYPEEYFSYMSSLAENKVFTEKNKGAELAKSVKDAKEAVTLGIGAEKYSIEFYKGMKKIVPEKDGITIDRIIEEEKKHLTDLTNIKEVLEF